MSLRLPGFIIAGAPRAATTWLYQVADSHPQIAMAKPANPEPKFFLIDSLYERGLEYYSETWFKPLPSRDLYGEKSTNYLEGSSVPERLGRELANVKLVFLLRNPVERAFSNFLWSTQNGIETEPSFVRALELEADRERNYTQAQNFSRPYSYFSRGLYAQHLRRFFARIPRERILVMKTEDITRDARDVAVRFHRFLEVEPFPDPAEAIGLVNAVVDRDSRLPLEAKVLLEERYREPNRQLKNLLGDSFAAWDYDFAT
jgi:hypothetical protein